MLFGFQMVTQLDSRCNLTGTNFAAYHFGSHPIADMNELCSLSL